MTKISDMYLMISTAALRQQWGTTVSASYEDSCKKFAAAVQFSQEHLEDYQQDIIKGLFSSAIDLDADSINVKLDTGIRSGEITMEFQMKGDLFDPFQVEAGCAHPEDYREPLPYYGATPSEDEWMCSGCGYWKKGSAFGVTPLPPAPKLTDEELEAELKKQSKRFDPGLYMNFPDMAYPLAGWDLAADSDVSAQFPISYPRVPMSNSHNSHQSIMTLIKELEARRRSPSYVFAPDIHVTQGGGSIDQLRIMTRSSGTRPMDQKDLIDAMYTLEYATRYTRAPRTFFEADPTMMSSLIKIHDTPAGPMVQRAVGQSSPSPFGYKMIGYDLMLSHALPRMTLSLALCVP